MAQQPAREPAFKSAPVDPSLLQLPPEALERRRRLADAMMKAGMSGAPIQSWTQGMAQVAQSVMGGLEGRWADDKERYGREAGTAAAMGLPDPGGAPPDSPFGYLLGGGGRKSGAEPDVGPQASITPPVTPDDGAQAKIEPSPGYGIPIKGPQDAADHAGPQSDPLTFARTMIGKGEKPDRAALMDYMKTGGANLDPATTAWCAAFVNASLGHAHMQGTNSNLARSFMDWGEKTDQPQPGDVAVFARTNDPTYGHVGFYQGVNPDGTIRVLGGNQGNKVGIANMRPGDLLGYRRAPPGAGPGGGGPTVASAPPEPQVPPQAAPGQAAIPVPPVRPGAGAPTATAGASDAPQPGLPTQPPPPQPLTLRDGSTGPGSNPPPIPPQLVQAVAANAQPTPGDGAQASLSPGQATVASAQAGPAPVTLPDAPQQPPPVKVAQNAPGQDPMAGLPPEPDMTKPGPTMMDIIKRDPANQRMFQGIINPYTPPAVAAQAMQRLQTMVEQESPAYKLKLRNELIEARLKAHELATTGLKDSQIQADIDAKRSGISRDQKMNQLTDEQIQTEPVNRAKIQSEGDLTREKILTEPENRAQVKANTQKTEAETPDAGQPPDEILYRRYADQELAAGREPKSREQFWNTKARSGAAAINTGAQTGVADMVKESRASAQAARSGLTSLRTARAALKSGMINGQFADEKVALTKAAKAFGIDVDDSGVVNAETFQSAIAPQIAATVKATVGTANISNSDREFAAKAAGGQITLDAKSIARLLDIGERAAVQVIKDHNELVNNAYDPSDPDKEVQRFNRVFTVKEPDPNVTLPNSDPGNSGSGSSTSNDALQQARDAISQGAPRDKVIEQLKSMGVNPAGL